MGSEKGEARLRHADAPAELRLKCSLSLAHAVLYGLGVTIGAGIYVLIGAASARAGMQAPLAFVLAALLMTLTAASFAELGGRMPVAAGEAAYVREGFGSDRRATLAGLIVIDIAIVSAAAISVGRAGYIGVFLALPEKVIIAGVVVAMGAIAAWGIKESVTFRRDDHHRSRRTVAADRCRRLIRAWSSCAAARDGVADRRPGCRRTSCLHACSMGSPGRAAFLRAPAGEPDHAHAASRHRFDRSHRTWARPVAAPR